MVTQKRIFITATGAGAGAQKEVWKTPGCSSYFAGAAFPYGTDQVDEFLGFKPDHYCSDDTSLDLAMASYMRAWNGRGCDAIGIGLTASVASKEPHRGEHRIHAAMVLDKVTISVTHILKKGKGETARERDGKKADRVIKDMIRLASGRNVPGFGAEATTERALDRFFANPYFNGKGQRFVTYEKGPLYPGAFNPPHKGHFQIAEAAGHDTIFSITRDSPHKGPLSLTEMLQRSKMFKGHRVIFSKGDPLYIDKARLAPGSVFVVGSDSLLRMLDPKWGPDIKTMLYEFVALYTTFLVAPRPMAGQMLTMNSVLDQCGIDYAIRNDLFKELKGFDPVEMSSTQIRNAE